jgi:hypothetical protein
METNNLTTQEQIPVVTQGQPAVIVQEPRPVVTHEQRTVAGTTSPGNNEFARRIVVFLFGIVQAVIILRIVFLLLDARESNALVSVVLDISQVFIAPFEGLLHTNALTSGGAVLDVAAVVALIGWTIIEFIVIAAIGIFRREPA